MEARGIVLDGDRGSLPFLLVHGEALVAAAAWSLGEAGVVLVDGDVPWGALAESLAESGEPLVLHDPLCPMTPPDFLAACVERAAGQDCVVVGVAPRGATGEASDGAAGAPVIWSPIVVPAARAAGLDDYPATAPDQLAGLVERLRAAGALELVEAPPAARRVASEADVRELEQLTSPLGSGD
jgi:2-C-methyl-D-erythritol 4-phosphate cytidylyltransferase